MPDYRHIAPWYDFLLRPFVKTIRRNVVKTVLALKPGLVLDVACGTGDQLRVLSENRINAVGIDLSEAMLRQCRRSNPAADCLLQDGTAMAFQPATFDLVMISFALHECGWPAAVDMLDEVYRVLKPGGQLLIVDYADLKQVRGHVRLAISAIEFLAGRDHFSNFRNYHRKGGLQALIDPHRFSLLASRKRAAGSIEIQEFKPLKDKALNWKLVSATTDYIGGL